MEGGPDILKQGLIRRIGNGETTHIWLDNWILRGEMMRPYGSRSPNLLEFVSELIDHTSATWDLAILEENCLPIDIMKTPLCTSYIADSWAWSFEKNENYFVRSAYRMMVDKKLRREAWLDGTSGSSSNDRDAESWKLL